MSYFRNVQYNGNWQAGGTYTFEVQYGIDPPTGGAVLKLGDGTNVLFNNNNETTEGGITGTDVTWIENQGDNWAKYSVTIPADLPAGTYYLKNGPYVYCTATWRCYWQYGIIGGPYYYSDNYKTQSGFGIDESDAYSNAYVGILQWSMAIRDALALIWESITCWSSPCPHYTEENYSQGAWEFVTIAVSNPASPDPHPEDPGQVTQEGATPCEFQDPARLPTYDPDFFWNDGQWTALDELAGAGGGRYNRQLVALGYNVIYFESYI